MLMETQWIGIWTNIRLTDVAPSAAGWAPVEHLWAKRRGSLGTTMPATSSDTLNPWKSRLSIFHRFLFLRVYIQISILHFPFSLSEVPVADSH